MAKNNAINNTAGVFSSDTTITAGTGIIITAGDMTITSGNLKLPSTTATPTGTITLGGFRFISNYGTNNTFIGQTSGNTTLTVGSAIDNTSVGINTLSGLTTGQQNVAIGFNSLLSLTTGSHNATLGMLTLKNMAGGSWNIACGNSAGLNYTTTESSNILLNHSGIVGESNVMRLGAGTGTGTQGLAQSFISGIRGITTVNNDAIAVLIDSAGQLGTTSSSNRFKENIEDLGADSSGIMNLRPVKFNYKESGYKATGLIAEEVNKICPALVANDENGDPFSVKYHDLPALLLNELQKLERRISVLEGN